MNQINILPSIPSRGVMSVEEFLQWARICRWKFYDLVKRGELRPKKIGSRTVIPFEEAERWLRSLPEVGPASTPVVRGQE